jgi:hypothetical protein
MLSISRHRARLASNGIDPECMPAEYWRRYAAKRHAVEAIAKAAAMSDVIPQDLAAERAKICGACEFLVGTPPTDKCSKAGHCAGCHKSRLRSTQCPVGRW